MTVLSFLHRRAAHSTDSEALKNYIDVKSGSLLPKSNTRVRHKKFSNRATHSGNRAIFTFFYLFVQRCFINMLFARIYKFETASVDGNYDFTRTTTN